MRNIEEIRMEISACDREIAELLTKRMNAIREMIAYKIENGDSIFEPEQEKLQQEMLDKCCTDGAYEQEKRPVFDEIITAGKKVQAKELLSGNVALIGFMGAGKSTVAHYLKDMLAMEEVETDAMIVEAEGMEIKDIFAKYGEPYFRNCESNAVIELQNHTQTIISCGGGLVMRDENVENLKKSSRIVLLTATPETILERVKGSDERPILNGNMNVEYISQLMDKRRAKYEAAADVVIQTDGKSVHEICEELIRKIQK